MKLIIPFMLFFFASMAFSQEDLFKECMLLTDQILGAGTAQDNESIVKFALQKIERCKGFLEPEDIAETYSILVRAYMELGDLSKGLKAANDGIDAFYSIPQNHIYKAEILFLLENKKDAEKSLEHGERIASNLINEISNIIYEGQPSAYLQMNPQYTKAENKELLEKKITLLLSKLEHYKTLVESCKTLRKLYNLQPID